MRVVLWIGNEPNQAALANKISEIVTIVGIVTETRLKKRQYTFISLLSKIVEKIFLPSVSKSWWNMLFYYQKKYSSYPYCAIIDVENINSNEAYLFTTALNPDLIVVSGTRIIKKHMFEIKPNIGIINLHTGLSPYVKGGPNCTNWCISNGEFHLIGNTVMWLGQGIDDGDIFATELTSFNGNESLTDVHIVVMEHAHDLYVRSIKSINSGNRNRVSQKSICEGKVYYNKDWSLHNKIKLVIKLSSLRKYVKLKSVFLQKVVVIPINENS